MLFIVLLLSALVSGGKEWVVDLDTSQETPEAFAARHHLVFERKLESLSDDDDNHQHHQFYKFTETAHTSRDVHQHIRAGEDGVRWAERQEPRLQYRRGKRAPDPLYPQQWHLHTHPFGVDADFCPNITGRGVTIAIVDDGLQHSHPDLRDNYDAAHSYDFNGNTADPTPRDSRDAHGTAAAGVAVASANNGHCGRGVAYSARVVGLRTIAGPVSDATEAEALTHNAIDAVDVYSCSWGPQDTGDVFGEAGYLVKLALARFVGARRGRFGKGSIYVWAAGNGRDNGDSCAFDEYAGSPYVVPIGAIDHEGKQSWYSEGCAALMAVAPSSGANKGITTIDLVGNAGYSPTECTSTFGGTSSAAPLAAGIIAGILQQRPELTWRDVKHVIAKGSTMVEPTDPDWHRNARGFHHSHKYGFGLLKMPPLMAAARKHQLVPDTQKIIALPEKMFPHAEGIIPLTYDIEVEGHGDSMTFVEHVMIKINVLHPERGRVVITLTSPEGTVSKLAEPRPRDTFQNYPLSGWTFTTVRHWGESQINGVWRLSVTDTKPEEQNVGTVTRVQFTLFGY